jgi:hypothetical protein
MEILLQNKQKINRLLNKNEKNLLKKKHNILSMRMEHHQKKVSRDLLIEKRLKK